MSWRLVQLLTGHVWAVPPLPPAPLPPSCSVCGVCLPNCCSASSGNSKGGPRGASPALEGSPRSLVWAPPESPAFAIGRGADCAVRLETPTCSRRHLYLRVLPPPLKDTLLPPEVLSESLSQQASQERLKRTFNEPCDEGKPQGFPASKAGRFFFRNASPNDTLVNGINSTAIWEQQRQHPHIQERKIERQQQQQQAAWLMHAGYVEVFPGDILQVAGEPSLSFLVLFFPSALSLNSNPDARQGQHKELRNEQQKLLQGQQHHQEEQQQQQRHDQCAGAKLLQCVQACHRSESPSLSVALLLCLLANKPLLQLDAVLAALLVGDSSRSSSRGVYLAAKISTEAAERLKAAVELPSLGLGFSSAAHRGKPSDGFVLSPTVATDWKFFVLHLAALDTALSRTLQEGKCLSQHGGNLAFALQRFSPAGVSRCGSLGFVPRSPLEVDRRNIFSGCLSLAITAAAFKRLSQLFGAGGGFSVCLLELHASLDATLEETQEPPLPQPHPKQLSEPEKAAAADALASALAPFMGASAGESRCRICCLFLGSYDDLLQGPKRVSLVQVLQIVISAIQQQQQQERQRQQEEVQQGQHRTQGLLINDVKFILAHERQAAVSVLSGCSNSPGALYASKDPRLQVLLEEAAEQLRHQGQQKQLREDAGTFQEGSVESQLGLESSLNQSGRQFPVGEVSAPAALSAPTPQSLEALQQGPVEAPAISPRKSSPSCRPSNSSAYTGGSAVEGNNEILKAGTQGDAGGPRKKASAMARFMAIREAIESAFELRSKNGLINRSGASEATTQQQQPEVRRAESEGEYMGLQRQNQRVQGRQLQQEKQKQQLLVPICEATTSSAGWLRKQPHDASLSVGAKSTRIERSIRVTGELQLQAKGDRKKFRKDLTQLHSVWRASVLAPFPTAGGELSREPSWDARSAKLSHGTVRLRALRESHEEGKASAFEKVSGQPSALDGSPASPQKSAVLTMGQQQRHAMHKLDEQRWLFGEGEENTDSLQQAEAAMSVSCRDFSHVQENHMQKGSRDATLGECFSLATRARLQRWARNAS